MRKTYRITWTDIYNGETGGFILSALNADQASMIARSRLDFYQVITNIEIIL